MKIVFVLANDKGLGEIPQSLLLSAKRIIGVRRRPCNFILSVSLFIAQSDLVKFYSSSMDDINFTSDLNTTLFYCHVLGLVYLYSVISQ